jgi:amidase
VQRLGLVRQSDIDSVETEMRRLFEVFDLLITPMLAHPPFPAVSWSERSWAANVVASLRCTPLAPVWNLLGWPAASVPMGMHTESNTPVAAQIVGPPGSEARILAVAEQIEHRHPWSRLAPPQPPT